MATEPTQYDLPCVKLLEAQSRWLAPARARLLRQAAIGRRRQILDLACGHGVVVPELVRRSAADALVVAADRQVVSLRENADRFSGAAGVCADAHALPFRSQSFDLIFCQTALFWMREPAVVLAEAARVLTAGGVFVALEPDFEAMIEYPHETSTRSIWVRALDRAGADPGFGRKLPGLLAEVGLSSKVQLLDRLHAPDPVRFELLYGLPLDDSEAKWIEQRRGEERASFGEGAVIAHLPFFLAVAKRKS